MALLSVLSCRDVGRRKSNRQCRCDTNSLCRGGPPWPPQNQPSKSLNDLRYALRTLLKQPGFAVVVVITLALGIGASTAIFSVVNAVLLRPLPFPNSDRLQVVWGNYRTLNIERLPAKAAEYEDYAKQTQVFDSVAAYANHSFNVSTGSEPERIRGAYVSASLFPMLEVQASAGPSFHCRRTARWPPASGCLERWFLAATFCRRSQRHQSNNNAR